MTRQWIMILGAMLLFSILAVGQTSKLSKEGKTLSANEYRRARLDAPVRNYSLTARNLLEALTTVAGNFEIPMGIVWVVSPDAHADFNFSWNDGTVEQVINKIVKSQPGYEIQKADIVIVLSNKAATDLAVVPAAGGGSIGASSSRYYMHVASAGGKTPLWSDQAPETLLLSNAGKDLVKNLRKRMEKK